MTARLVAPRPLGTLKFGIDALANFPAAPAVADEPVVEVEKVEKVDKLDKGKQVKRRKTVSPSPEVKQINQYVSLSLPGTKSSRSKLGLT